MGVINRFAANMAEPAASACGQLGGRQAPLLFAPDEAIYSQGDPAGHLYRVELGAVRIYRLRADGRRQICAFHLPGEVFGFAAAGHHHFFADAITLTGLRAFTTAQSADLASDMVECAIRALVSAQEHLLAVGRQNASERIAAFLLDMSKRQGGLSEFGLPMTRADIGDYLGLTIETVSRVISKLRHEGVVRLLGMRRIEITNQPALAMLLL